MRCWKLKGSEMLYRGDTSARHVSLTIRYYPIQSISPSPADCIRLCLEPGLCGISWGWPFPLVSSSQSKVCNDVKSCLLFCRLSSLVPLAINALPKLSELPALVCVLPPENDRLSMELRGVDRSNEGEGESFVPSKGVWLTSEEFLLEHGRLISSVNDR